MTKSLVMLINLLWAAGVFCAPQTGDDVLNAMSRFNPATVIKDYTQNPGEAALPAGDKEALQAKALSRLREDETATFIRNQAKARARVRPNANAAEMQYAEALLEKEGDGLDGRCYEVQASCTGEQENKTCQEQRLWQTKACGKTLEIRFKPVTQTIERLATGSSNEPYFLHLTTCDPYHPCTLSQQIQLSPNCHRLSLTVSDNGAPVKIVQAPTCANPVATLAMTANGAYGEYIKTLKVTLTQWLPEDHWVPEDCQVLQHKVGSNQCLMEPGEVCIDANQSKVIEGYPLKRACWGIKNTYHCQGELKSGCKTLMSAGCSQTNSLCMHDTSGFCDTWQQTFACAKPCSKTRLICPGKPHCADGACDNTVLEQSNDIQEGLSSLAVLAASAGGIAETAATGKPNAFAGKSLTCKKTIAGVRDCCRDSGWGDWVVHCPASMQELIKARHENRAIYLGHYKDGLEKIHVYCVFPSLIAAIVQREGRGGQLKLSFGTAKTPDCRGISPEELAAIRFEALDFSPLTDTIKSRLQLPDEDISSERLQAAIEAQYREMSHD